MIYIVLLLIGIVVNSGQINIGNQTLSKQLEQLLPQIQLTIAKGRENIWQQMQKDQPIWDLPPWLGTFFLSEYYFQLKALNITGDLNFKTQFDLNFFKQKLLRQQQSDGSWKQLVDLNQKKGSLDATIFNYWFLKDIGVSLDSQSMRKAKKFILDHGGIENAQIMTKYKLATFGVYEWILLPYVPLFIFSSQFPFYSYGYMKNYIAQWVYPHLTGLAYLRYHKTVFPVSRVCLQQLRTSRSDHCQQYKSQHPGLTGFKNHSKDSSVDHLLEQIIKLRGNKGGYGGYTISTLLNLLSFKDYTLRYTHQSNFKAYYNQNLQGGLQYVQYMYFNKRTPYEGNLCDGRYWDTLLSSFALLQSGQKAQKLSPVVQNLIKKAVQPNGGIPYGQQFQYAPDIDDTAILLVLYGKMLRQKVKPSDGIDYNHQINRTYNWVRSNQNTDGGFPAFDKDKNDDQYTIVKWIFKITRIDKSAQIFDPSCSDIVGHILEGMGQCHLIDIPTITKAVKFLYDTRKDGMWSARWGINYVYAVGSVFPGLSRVGYSLDQEWIANVTRRLKEVQQEDGGFGEDSQSYNTDKYKQGVTTATMTAWGLLAYLQLANIPSYEIQQNITNAAKYLLNNFKQNNNKFYDRSVVGTGHRGVLNLQYAIYAYTFPLIALSRLQKVIKGQYFQSSASKELTDKVNADARLFVQDQL